MVTATLNRERRTPIDIDDEDDEHNERQTQTHLVSCNIHFIR